MTAGQMQLQSTTWLQKHTGDRPSFEATVCRMFSARPFQVFAMPQGLLFLELRNKPGVGGGPSGAVVAGAVLGGAIGACIGAAIAGNASSNSAERGASFDLCSEEELIELARSRKRSFVVKNDEVRSVSIDAPRGFNRLFADQNFAGWITVRANKLGKITLEVNDQSAMSVAVDALPRRFGERVAVNVELDQRTARFVSKRR